MSEDQAARIEALVKEVQRLDRISQWLEAEAEWREQCRRNAPTSDEVRRIIERVDALERPFLVRLFRRWFRKPDTRNDWMERATQRIALRPRFWEGVTGNSLRPTSDEMPPQPDQR